MIFAPDLILTICLRTAEGESMRAICRDPEMPSRTRLQKELLENAGFAAQYAVARELLYQGWADEILEISDDGTTDYITKVGRNGHEYEAVDQEHIQRSRLRVDSRKWMLSKLLPKQFGDKVEHEHGGEVAHRVDITGLSEREKMRRFALFMLEDQAAGITIDGHASPAMPAMPAPDGGVTKSQQPAAGRTTEPSVPASVGPIDKE
jgi:hypothetical protein